jgi:hypothetical protein
MLEEPGEMFVPVALDRFATGFVRRRSRGDE